MINQNQEAEKVKIVIVKKPQKQEMTAAENSTISAWAWEDYGRTTAHAHDDMLSMLRAGNTESYAVVWHPDRPSQVEAIKLLKAEAFNYWVMLDVPHIAQYGPGANQRVNDCGAANAAMIIRGITGQSPTVDEIAIKYQTNPNKYMNFSDIDRALNGYGVDGLRRQPIGADAIRDAIESGRPVIALVWYKFLPFQFSGFNGSHFISIYGSDGRQFLYRDSLSPSGGKLHISHAQLEKAMQAVTAEYNQPNQAMICYGKD